MHFWHLLFIYTLLETAMACPPNCVCKWKGGKQTVECVNKSLVSIPATGIDSGTQVLDFTGNNLKNVSDDQFQRLGIVNLQKIFLSRCRLTAVDEHAFAGLTNLVELDLSNNILAEVPHRIFHDVTSLMRLNLNGNPIKRIRAFTFKTLKYLVTLELSRCQLETVERDAFYGLDALGTLKLDFNALKFVAGPTTIPRRLHGVSLQHNPWFCDCKLADLYAWLNASNVSQAVEPICDGPVRLRGAPIKLLDEQELACLPDVSPTSLYLEIVEGKNVSLLCRVNAVPEAKVSWRLRDRVLQNDSMVAPGVHLYYFVEEGTVEKRSELFIFNANVDDNGTFICAAENQAGRAQSNYTIRIVLKEEPIMPAKRIPLEYVAVVCVAAAALLIALVVTCAVTCLVRSYRVKRRRRRKKEKSKELALYRDVDGRASPITRSGETLSTISGDGGCASGGGFSIGISSSGGGGFGNGGGFCTQKSNGSIFGIADHHPPAGILKMSTADLPSAGTSCASRIFYSSSASCNNNSNSSSATVAFSPEPNPDLINDTGKERKLSHSSDSIRNSLCAGANTAAIAATSANSFGKANCAGVGGCKSGDSNANESMMATVATVSYSTLAPCSPWETATGTCNTGLTGGVAATAASATATTTTNVINVPVNVCFNHFQARDIHLAPDKFLVDGGGGCGAVYPTDYGLPKLSTHFPPILPATAFYRTLPHRRHNASAAAAQVTAACNQRYVREAEFLTRSAQPASYEHFLSGDVRYNVEGYPKDAAAGAYSTSYTTPHVSFCDTVQILGAKSSDSSIESTSGAISTSTLVACAASTATTTTTTISRADVKSSKKEHLVNVSLINAAAQTHVDDLQTLPPPPYNQQPLQPHQQSTIRKSSTSVGVDSAGGAADLKLSKAPRLYVCVKNTTDSPDEGYVGEGPDTTEV